MTSKLQILTNPLILTITSISGLCAFICSYFLNLYMNNQDQYTAVIGVMFLDGIFGIIRVQKERDLKHAKP